MPVKPAAFYYGRVKPSRQRLFQGHFKRWHYGMRARRAGELTQVDHMSVALCARFGIKEFKAAGPVTGIIVLKAYRRASSHCAKDFLEYLIAQAPFKICLLPIAGGSEFRDGFGASIQSTRHTAVRAATQKT